MELQLRSFSGSDVEFIHEGLSDSKVIQYYGIQCMTINDAKDQLAWFRNLEANDTGKWFLIEDKAGTKIGGCGLNNVDTKNRKAEIGFWLLPAFWGKGIMKNSIQEVIQHGVKVWNLHRVEAYVEPLNVSCMKLLKKQGFQFEGTLRQCEIKDDEFIDIDVYSWLS